LIRDAANRQPLQEVHPMPIPSAFAVRNAHFSTWRHRFGRAQSKLRSAIKNARYIERLIQAPQTIGPDAAASLVRSVNLVIESRCNIRCPCCHYFATRNAAALDRGFNLPRMLELIDEVPHAGIGITGGEPLMAPARVVEAAQALLQRGRQTTLVTNSLPLFETKRGEVTRDLLLNGLSREDRAKLRVRCSVDLQHYEGGNLPLDEYIAKCHAAIRFLTSSGFPVSTRSIVTTREEYEFFRDHVLPLKARGVTLAASVQPDIYALPKFATAFQRQELGDVGARLGSSYLKLILDHAARGPNSDAAADRSIFRTAPWVLIEVNARGVKGPSGFLTAETHHQSVLEMLRSYDWLHIADSMMPQITISHNAFLYRIDRRNRSVTLNIPYILGKFLQR
jgi:hypothetical protein